MEDEFFAVFATPNEEVLVDMSSVRRSIRYEEAHVENGKVVEV